MILSHSAAMKPLSVFTSLAWPLLASICLSPVLAEPVQYCRRGSPGRPNEEIDFCMGALMYQNASSNAHDLFVTMTVRRQENSALGWTAIGAGSTMKGALMFIVYGDPLSGEQPIVSIRGSTGHHQPALLSQSDLPRGMDFRVVSSLWLKDDKEPSVHTATVYLVCYSCHLWAGTDISAQSSSQPWIWAWNNKQEFDVFSFDAHLDMHKHHAGAGGWGNFYLDMKRTVNTAHSPPSLPPIRPEVSNVGTSDTPMTFSDSIVSMTVGPASFFHGIILGLAFLLLFPAGVIGMRSGSPKSYTYHWAIQMSASILLLVGLGLGLMKGRKINTTHQSVGIALASSIGLQGILGYWHHVRFLRLRRRTWVSYAHVWLGRLIMVGGWSNVVSGLLLRGFGKSSAIVVAVTVAVCMEAVGLSGWVWWVQRRRARYIPKASWAKEDEGSFALSTSDDDDDDDADDAPKNEPEIADSEVLLKRP